MEISDLEYFLARGDQLGLVKETSSPDYLGWILLRKYVADTRYI